MGRTILFLGLTLALIGGLLMLAEKYDVKNPLDFRFAGENWTFYLPLGTSIIVSIVLSLLIYFFKK